MKQSAGKRGLSTTAGPCQDHLLFDAIARSWTSVTNVVVGTSPERSSRSLRIGVAALAGMGIAHFVVPRPFDSIIPGWVPGDPRPWTYASGVGELGAAALLVNPRTRRFGGYLAAATFVTAFPANIQMSIDRPPTTPYGVALAARLPLQVPMVAWALGHARAAQT